MSRNLIIPNRFYELGSKLMAVSVRALLLFAALTAPFAAQAQDDDPKSHRGVQFAAQGTDFWVCFPRTLGGFSPNNSVLYVVCEHDCDVTVTNELIDYSQTYHVMGRRMCGPDTNYIRIPFVYSWINDTVPYQYLSSEPERELRMRPPRYDYRGCAGNRPQAKAFHVTSTDTISLFIMVGSTFRSACTVLPTELLRDEYVAQPPIVNHRYPQKWRYDFPVFPFYLPGMSSIDIVAVEDSTVVDIAITDWDWLNRPPGDTFSVTLRRGELFHLSAGEPPEKYYPNLFPYSSTDIHGHSYAPVVSHSFLADTLMLDTFAVDLAGTRIKARDCKKIAVFESSGIGGSGLRGQFNANYKLEQSIPTFFAGREYFIPYDPALDPFNGTPADLYIRLTALEEGATVTICDVSRPALGSRTLVLGPYQTDWWKIENDQGPYHITSDHPVLAKRVGRDLTTITPTRWWHWGQVNFGTITQVDENHNRHPIYPNLHIFARTEDVGSMKMDYYPIGSYFQPMAGTPYSHAYFDMNSQFTTEGTHHIVSTTDSPFMAYFFANYYIGLPHVQPGGVSMRVNGRAADSLRADSLWCVFDPVELQAVNRRPFDSVWWFFGDGSDTAFAYAQPQASQPLTHLFQQTGLTTVRAVFTYQYDSCFTLKPDTVEVTLDIRGPLDTLISVRLCEGSYFFRDHELDHTDTYFFTTYWEGTQCDTTWQIDLVTCPHCRWWYDTVSPDDVPVVFNGHSFGHECHDEPVHIHINDTCDSIIYYNLTIIPNWGEKPIDSTWIAAPNVFTPTLESNSRFALTCSPHIQQAEVSVFDRRGARVARFDGLGGSWDGTANGSPCPQGTYVYYVRYIDTHDKAYKTLTCTVTLLR